MGAKTYLAHAVLESLSFAARVVRIYVIGSGHGASMGEYRASYTDCYATLSICQQNKTYYDLQ